MARTIKKKSKTYSPSRKRLLVQEWEADVSIVYDASLISAEDIVNLLNYAGSYVGIGDKRREQGFEHGGFKVVDIQKKGQNSELANTAK